MTLIREIININYLVTSGHPGYMAPEIICRQKHGAESDFFSLGVILYEIMFNKLPYNSNSREEYLNDISSSHNALIKEDELNIGWSRECADFINRCIQKTPEYRIGFGGIEELKTHIWIKDFNWEHLKKKELTAPFILRGKNNFNLRNYNEDKLCFSESKIYNFIEYYENMKYFNGYIYNYKLDSNYNKDKIDLNEINENNIDQKTENKDIINILKEDIENKNYEKNNVVGDKIDIMKDNFVNEKLIDEEKDGENDNNKEDDNFKYNVINKKCKKNKKKNEKEYILESTK